MAGGQTHSGPRIRSHIRLGRAGEEAAARHLCSLGWTVLERNWRPTGPAQGLELDIVARDGGTLVFVEVKTRANASAASRRPNDRPDGQPDERPGYQPVARPDYRPGARQGLPALAVPARDALTAQKQARLVRAASRYLTAKENWSLPCRFDLVCIELDKNGTPSLEHYTDVIELGHLVDRGHTAWQPW